MHNFKVGDRVIGMARKRYQPEPVGTVRAVSDDAVWIDLDKPYGMYTHCTLLAYQTRLEPKEPEVVWVSRCTYGGVAIADQNGRPPDDRPFVELTPEVDRALSKAGILPKSRA